VWEGGISKATNSRWQCAHSRSPHPTVPEWTHTFTSGTSRIPADLRNEPASSLSLRSSLANRVLRRGCSRNRYCHDCGVEVQSLRLVVMRAALIRLEAALAVSGQREWLRSCRSGWRVNRPGCSRYPSWAILTWKENRKGLVRAGRWLVRRWAEAPRPAGRVTAAPPPWCLPPVVGLWSMSSPSGQRRPFCASCSMVFGLHHLASRLLMAHHGSPPRRPEPIRAVAVGGLPVRDYTPSPCDVALLSRPTPPGDTQTHKLASPFLRALLANLPSAEAGNGRSWLVKVMGQRAGCLWVAWLACRCLDWS